MMTHSAIPHPLRPTVPSVWRSAADASLLADAGGETNFFISPVTHERELNAPMLLFPASGEQFLLSAQVEVGFNGTFDAGALVIYAGNDQWGKLCFEYSPQCEPMIVSVVTNGLSDDCNSVVIAGNTVWLRAGQIGRDSFVFHYSTNGRDWRLVRVFALPGLAAFEAGFLAQAPRGSGCRVTFRDVRFGPYNLADPRSGE